MKTDEEIAQLVQSGNFELFEILVQRYEAKIKRYSRKFLFKNEEAKDALQDIFIKAYKNINSFDSKQKFSPWIYRIAHNELINAIKKRKKTFPLPDLDTFLPSYEKREYESKKATKEIIDKSLNSLEVKYKEVIVLYYQESLSYKEIADVLQIPISTVGVRLKRAKKIIKQTYDTI